MTGVLSFARALADSGKYFMATINNESRELNLYRIKKYDLRDIFSVFVSSCLVGMRKAGERHLPAGDRNYSDQSARVLLHRRSRAESGVRG